MPDNTDKKQSLFREKNLKRLESPEKLNDYLRVTNPAIWAVLGAIILLIAAVFVWSSFTSVESYVTGTAHAKNGVLTIEFDSEDAEKYVETGMMVTVGDTQAEIQTIGKAADSRIVAGAEANVPDGDYEVKVTYKRERILSLLFN